MRYVTYYRVSTQRQGRSGLGLEAQQAAVEAHLGKDVSRVLAEFTEVESGKRNDRPQLRAALERCKLTGATLLVAKLDRLARNVFFVSSLMESGVDFRACDFPQANRLTIHILAAVAEHEAEAISTRTRAALAAAKARGKKLGSPGNLTDEARSVGRKAAAQRISTKADDFARRVASTLNALRGEGLSFRQIAIRLEAEGVRTGRGKTRWSAATVRRVHYRSVQP